MCNFDICACILYNIIGHACIKHVAVILNINSENEV